MQIELNDYIDTIECMLFTRAMKGIRPVLYLYSAEDFIETFIALDRPIPGEHVC